MQPTGTPEEGSSKGRVNYIGLILMMCGGRDRRIIKAAQLFPKELLEAALDEGFSDPRQAAEVARYYEGADLEALAKYVLDCDDIFAWKELAESRSDMADEIQQKLIDHFEERNRNPDSLHRPFDYHFLKDFLRDTKGSNPTPLQAAFVRAGKEGELVDMTVRFPKRTCLFSTVALLLTKSRTNITRNIGHLCTARPEATAVVQACLLELGVHPSTVMEICSVLPGIDLDAVEQMIVDSGWNDFDKRQFCAKVKRDRGPLRDFYTVEHVMES